MSCPPTERKSVPGTHRSSPVMGPIRGAYQPRSHPARLQGLRHTGRHHPRHAPYPARGQRRSHTASVDEEDIGTSDSSSTTSDYSSGESEGGKDELEGEEEEEDSEDVPSQGFGFSAATWSSTNGTHVHGAGPGGRVDTHYEKKDVHYVMEERHSRYYPAPHQARPSNHYPRRSSLSPERPHSFRRPVSPEPLYREYREYRDSHRHHRDRISRTSRSSQTSPVRVEPIHSSTPRTFVRALTPSRYRRPLDKQRPKYQYESRVPPPPPSLSAPLTLRPPPPSIPPPARSSAALSSNAHTAPLYHSAPSPPTTKPSRAPLAPPRLVLPPRENDDYDLGEDEVDDDDKDDYKPLPNPPPAVPAPVPAPRPLSNKRNALLSNPGGSSTSTFALSGGPSAPANNNGTTSTTTTFHVTTPRAISASLAAAQNAAAAAAQTAPLPVESEKADAEKMRIPSFKRGGKTRYECLYCSKDFSRKNDAYRHMSRKHNDNATEFICVCGRVLSRGDALTRHMRTCRESKDKGSQVAVAISGSPFAQGAPVKVSASMPKKRGTKKKRGPDVLPPPGGAIDMDVDGEEELVDDVSMEEED